MKKIIQVNVRPSNRSRTNGSYNTRQCSKVTVSRQLRKILPAPNTYYSSLPKFYQRNIRQAIARCPFHDDSRPSLSIHLLSGMYLCFACGASGGNILCFQMDLFHQSKDEAIKAILGGETC